MNRLPPGYETDFYEPGAPPPVAGDLAAETGRFVADDGPRPAAGRPDVREAADLAARPDLAARIDSAPKELTRAETSPIRQVPIRQDDAPLPFRPLREALADVPEEPGWLWAGYIAAGALTLLAGKPKVGKSTLLFALLRALAEGEPFLGRPTRRAGALLLSEERPDTLREKQLRFDLNGAAVHLLMRYEARGCSLPEVVSEAAAYCRAHGLDLLAIDPLDKWAPLPGDSENNSGFVLEAIAPLAHAAAGGLAVLVSAHQRKAGGEHGEAVRGSNALAGTADVVVELERLRTLGEESARVLKAVSRFATTPEELALMLAGGEYLPLGTTAEVVAASERERLLETLSADVALSSRELAELTDLPEGTVRKLLHELGDALVREGRGKRGDPYRWHLADSFPHDSTVSAETIRNGG